MSIAEQSKTLSLMMLVQRIILALAFLFLAIGETLHLNAFVQNGIDIGLPFSRILSSQRDIKSSSMRKMRKKGV